MGVKVILTVRDAKDESDKFVGVALSNTETPAENIYRSMKLMLSSQYKIDFTDQKLK